MSVAAAETLREEDLGDMSPIAAFEVVAGAALRGYFSTGPRSMGGKVLLEGLRSTQDKRLRSFIPGNLALLAERSTLYFRYMQVPYRSEITAGRVVRSFTWGVCLHMCSGDKKPNGDLLKLYRDTEVGKYDTTPTGLYIARPYDERDDLIPFWILPDKKGPLQGYNDTKYRFEVATASEVNAIYQGELIPAANDHMDNCEIARDVEDTSARALDATLRARKPLRWVTR